jgi:hypothetical protein
MQARLGRASFRYLIAYKWELPSYGTTHGEHRCVRETSTYALVAERAKAGEIETAESLIRIEMAALALDTVGIDPTAPPV